MSKLRKTRKSLNSKQRLARKAGNELSDADTIELNKVTADQTVIQKQLENARKQSRQHGLLVQDYNSKHQPKNPQQMVQPQQPINHPGTPPDLGFFPRKSPHPAAADAPLMSPMSVQSPLSNPMLQPSCSPMHSPSPLMSQSPVPGARYAFAVPQCSSMKQCLILFSIFTLYKCSMSPYNSMQPSPRIGTPHSQPDESAFSPGTIG